MMDDAQRLRWYAGNPPKSPTGYIPDVKVPPRFLRAAADQIERLRALVEFYEQGGKPMDQVMSEIDQGEGD